MTAQRSLFEPARPAPKPPRSFFANGSNLSPAEYAAGQERGASQEARILAYLKAHPASTFTAWDIADAVGDCAGVRAPGPELPQAPRARDEAAGAGRVGDVG